MLLMTDDESSMANVSQISRLVQKFQSLSAKKLVLKPEKENDDDESCIKALGQRMLDLFISILLLASVALPIFFGIHVKTCPVNYDTFLPFRGQCYHFYGNGSVTWTQAQTHCQDSGGYLLELYTLSEIDYMKKLFNFTEVALKDERQLWLGATDHRNSKLFSWNVTGREPAYSIPWVAQFPSKTSSQSTCVSLLHKFGFQWINMECYEKAHFICKLVLMKSSMENREKDEDEDEDHDEGNKNSTMEYSNITSTETTADSSSSSSSSFKVIKFETWAQEAFRGSTEIILLLTPKKELCWSEARSVCQSRGMDLAILDSEAKFRFIQVKVNELID